MAIVAVGELRLHSRTHAGRWRTLQSASTCPPRHVGSIPHGGAASAPVQYSPHWRESMSSRRARVCLFAFVIAACGPTTKHHGGAAGTDGTGSVAAAPPLPHTLTSLAVSPTNQLVELDLNQTGSQDFTVMASYADGASEDVTSQVTWTV